MVNIQQKQKCVTYSVQDVADIVGVSYRTIYRMAEKKEIPGAFFFGKRLKFNKDIVLTWLSAKPVQIEAVG